MDTLSKAGFNNQTVQKVMIQSSESSVLEEFKKSNYELVYMVDNDIRDIENSTLLEMKTFAKSVVITKDSVFPSDSSFLIGQTNIVPKLQSANLPVYVRLFNNEFISQPWDFFSDSSAELNNFVLGAGVDGVITEYPGTAARYRSKLFIWLVISHTVFQPGPTSSFPFSCIFSFCIHHRQISFSINESLVLSVRFVYILPELLLGVSIKLCVRNARLLDILNSDIYQLLGMYREPLFTVQRVAAIYEPF